MTPARLPVLLLLAGGLAACGRSSPTAPTPAAGPYAGTWAGSLTDADGTVAVRFEMQDRRVDASRSLLSGVWRLTPGGPSGALSGTVTGGTATLVLTPDRPEACPSPTPFPHAVGTYVAPALTIAPARLSGSYQRATCTGSVAGTLVLSPS